MLQQSRKTHHPVCPELSQFEHSKSGVPRNSLVLSKPGQLAAPGGSKMKKTGHSCLLYPGIHSPLTVIDFYLGRMKTTFPSLPCSQGWSCDWAVANGEERCVLTCWVLPSKEREGLYPFCPLLTLLAGWHGDMIDLWEKPHPKDDRAARWKEPETLKTAERRITLWAWTF